MTDFFLLKSQKNEVFQAIQNNDFQPEEFEWNVEKSRYSSEVQVLRLVHKFSGYFYQFENHRDLNYGWYSPGVNFPAELTGAASWSEQILNVNAWLKKLKRELEEPDLWEAIAKEKVLSEISVDQNENIPFSIEEKPRIQESLNEIKQFLISSQSFSADQLNYLDARFNYLEDAASRLGRKDWIIIVIGTLMNTIITLAITPSIARDLFRLAGTILGWLVKIPLLP